MPSDPPGWRLRRPRPFEAMRRYHYRWGEGLWSHLFHRVSGIALVVYLSMHIWVVHNLQKGREAYDALMKTLSTPIFRVGEAFLLAAVLYHGLNGIRLVAMDCGLGMRAHRATYWIVFGVCAALGIAGCVILVFCLA